MDPQAFLDIATKITKLKMYPYFDIAHYTLMCMAARDDIPQSISGEFVSKFSDHQAGNQISLASSALHDLIGTCYHA